MVLITNLLKSYLHDRPLFVEFRSHKSFNFIATSGAPQGSNLAPLLFTLFINDIGTDINSEILSFADDLKMFRPLVKFCLDYGSLVWMLWSLLYNAYKDQVESYHVQEFL